ncbi:Ff.00g075590.m01.CDS01 [Fusarium sp. VM40]|nr:Ff.00g075590.m01.CDS01 [Fusarium sp. VM40]
MEKLSKMKARLAEEFPGIDPSSWKSPGFKKPRTPAKSRADVGSKSSASKEQSSRVGSEDRAYLSGGNGGGDGGDDYEDEDDQVRLSSESRKRTGSHSSRGEAKKPIRSLRSPWPNARRLQRHAVSSSPRPSRQSTPGSGSSRQSLSGTARTSGGNRSMSSMEKLRLRHLVRTSSTPQRAFGRLIRDREAVSTPGSTTLNNENHRATIEASSATQPIVISPTMSQRSTVQQGNSQSVK